MEARANKNLEGNVMEERTGPLTIFLMAYTEAGLEFGVDTLIGWEKVVRDSSFGINYYPFAACQLLKHISI